MKTRVLRRGSVKGAYSPSSNHPFYGWHRLIVWLYCWGPNIQYIDGKWVNVKKLEERNRKPEPYNAFEYYCKIDPMYAQRYDECFRTNFFGEELKDDEFEDL